MTADQIGQIVNRHMARILTDLEDAGCPAMFREVIKGRLQWLRSDLTKPDARDEYPKNNG